MSSNDQGAILLLDPHGMLGSHALQKMFRKGYVVAPKIVKSQHPFERGPVELELKRIHKVFKLGLLFLKVSPTQLQSVLK